jgi:hypothetical protein
MALCAKRPRPECRARDARRGSMVHGGVVSVRVRRLSDLGELVVVSGVALRSEAATLPRPLTLSAGIATVSDGVGMAGRAR